MELVAKLAPVIDTNAYSAGDCVGGVLITKGFQVGGGGGVLHSVLVVDLDDQNVPLEVLIFDSDPTADAGWVADNNDPFEFGASHSRLIARIPVAAGDYVPIDSIAIANVRGLGAVLQVRNPGGKLWVVLVAGGAGTFTDTDRLAVQLGLLQQ